MCSSDLLMKALEDLSMQYDTTVSLIDGWKERRRKEGIKEEGGNKGGRKGEGKEGWKERRRKERRKEELLIDR